MKKALSSILFVLYAIIAITVTVLLLSYNEYNNSQLGGYTVYIVKDDSLEPKYKQGSILLIKSTTDKNVQIGDELFLYRVMNSQEYDVVTRNVTEKLQQGRHIVYKIGEDESYANDYLIGRADDTIVIEGWGYILSLLESRWGYLFCVVIVSLLLFLQEVFELVMEIRYGGGKNKKKDAVEVEHKAVDDSEEEEVEEKVVKKAPAKKPTTKKSTNNKTASTTAHKTTGAKKTTAKKTTSATANKTTGTKKTTGTTTNKTAGAKKTTSTKKTTTTKSAKEEK